MTVTHFDNVSAAADLGLKKDETKSNQSSSDSTSATSTSSTATLVVPAAEGSSWKVVGSPARRASSTSGAFLETPCPSPQFNSSANSIFEADHKRSRTLSVSSVAPPGLADFNPSIWTNNSNSSPPLSDVEDSRDRFFLATTQATPEITIMTEEEYSNMPKSRSRSKSSSAIFGLNSSDLEMQDTFPDSGLMSTIWRPKHDHRRQSTQPSQQTLVWEALRASQLATPNDMNGNHAEELLDKFKSEHDTGARRFSVAPSMVNRFMNRNVQEVPAIQEEDDQEYGSVLQVPSSSQQHQFEQRRRHSMAGPVFDRKLNTKFLSEGFQALGLENSTRHLERIDDYFENTESRTRAFREAGKNLQANHQEIVSPIFNSDSHEITEEEEEEEVYTWPLYVVEFKAGRTDYFYISSDLAAHLTIRVGDLAIVEADRGKDLGKVIETGINSMSELHEYQATHEDPLVDSHNAIGKEIRPKRLFRLAEPSEVAMLLQKGQDEVKAHGACQLRIRQKKLAMEIVDAEYQWDRRKLTFYFIADRRIDFRELVRELFKVYKTRIWMCAVRPKSELVKI